MSTPLIKSSVIPSTRSTKISAFTGSGISASSPSSIEVRLKLSKYPKASGSPSIITPI